MDFSKISRSSIFFAVSAAACVAGAIALRTLRPVATNSNDPTLEMLSQQMAELAPFSTLALNRAHEAKAAAEQQLWTSSALVDWRAGVPPAWRVQEVAPIPGIFTIQRRFLLKNPNAAFRDWPDIVAFLATVADKPALRIHSLSISAPAGSRRNFTHLNLLLGFATAKSNPTSDPAAQP